MQYHSKLLPPPKLLPRQSAMSIKLSNLHKESFVSYLQIALLHKAKCNRLSPRPTQEFDATTTSEYIQYLLTYNSPDIKAFHPPKEKELHFWTQFIDFIHII